MMYALREALRIIWDETREVRFARHRVNHLALVAGLEAMGFEMHVAEGQRLWSLNTVKLPAGVDDIALRKAIMEQFSIEVLSGFGPLAGKILRIGLMGASSTRNNVLLFLEALESCMSGLGHSVAPGGARAAEAVYAQQAAASGAFQGEGRAPWRRTIGTCRPNGDTAAQECVRHVCTAHVTRYGCLRFPSVAAAYQLRSLTITMKFAIFGAGAIGALVGSRLIVSGEEVALIARGPHLAAMRERGLVIRSQVFGDYDCKPFATDDLESVGPVDFLILAVKAHSLRGIAPTLAPSTGRRNRYCHCSKRDSLVVSRWS